MRKLKETSKIELSNELITHVEHQRYSSYLFPIFWYSRIHPFHELNCLWKQSERGAACGSERVGRHMRAAGGT